MGFNSAFKGLRRYILLLTVEYAVCLASGLRWAQPTVPYL